MLYKNKKFMFISKIQLNAKAEVNFEKIKSHLINHKSLNLLNDNNSLVYVVKTKDLDYYSTLELFKDKISFITYSNSFPFLYYSDSLLKLILLLSFMKDIYTVQLSELYPYLIELFKNTHLSNTNKFEISNKKSSNINPPELILSKRIIDLLNENKSLNSDLSKKSAENILFFYKFIILKYSNRVNILELSKDLDISEQHAKLLLSDFNKYGISIKWLNKNEFAVIK